MPDVFKSIVSFIMNKVGYKANSICLFENVKDGYAYPAFYFPTPIETIGKETLNYTHSESSQMFLQIFHNTTSNAMELANKTKEVILKNAGFIPILNYDGSETGDRVKVYVKKIQKIDEGIAQVTLNWTCHANYVPAEEKIATNILVGIATEGEKNG